MLRLNSFIFLSFITFNCVGKPSVGLQNNDSSTVDLMLNEAYSLEIENPDSALAIYTKVAILSSSIPYIIAKGRAYLYSGIVLSDQGEFDKAIAFYKKAIATFETTQYIEGIGSAYVNLGNIEKRKAQYGKALAYYLDGTRIFESLKDTNRIIYAYSNIGAVLSDVEQYDKSITYNNKSIALSRLINDSISICDGLVNKGMIYIELNQLDSAKAQYDLTYQIASRTGDAHILYLVYSNWCTIASTEEQYENAFEYATKSLEIASTLNNPVFLSNAYAQIGQIYYTKNELDSARFYLLKGIDLAEESSSWETLMTALENIATLEESLGNNNQAFLYFKKLKNLEEEEARLRQKKVMAGLEMEYESEKKDLLISEKNLELEKNEALLANRNLLIVGLVVALFLASLIFILIKNSLSQKRRIAEQEAALTNEKVIQLEKEHEVLSLKAMLEGEEKERSRLAKDLHDGLGGMLSAAKLRFGKLKIDYQDLNESIEYSEALNLIDETSAEARRISHNLEPGALDKFGLIEALEDFCQSISISSATEINFQAIDIKQRLNPNLEKSIYRIIQELVNNAVKHAHAKEIIVQIMQINSEIHITVEDDGIGFDKGSFNEGFGFRSLRSRIDFLRGKFDFDSNPSDGSSFQVSIPIQ
jgi:signal transduction histidine kinase